MAELCAHPVADPGRYHVDELTASSADLGIPALYVVLSLHAGALIDRRGYRYSVSPGALLMTVFAALRIYTGSFTRCSSARSASRWRSPTS